MFYRTIQNDSKYFQVGGRKLLKRLTLQVIKTYHKARAILKPWYCHRDRQLGQ